MRTALLLIACGERYWRYADAFVDTAKRFFVPHEVVLFTDAPRFRNFDVAYKFLVEPLGYPQATLQRYRLFAEHCDWLSRYENLFYSDVDMQFVAHVAEEDIFSEGITATLHPGYAGLCGTPETRPESTAYAKHGLRNYFCGGFNGGKMPSFLAMADELHVAIDNDTRRGIVAVWHDESHLNRYLYDNPPARILSPAFCYPDVQGDYYKNIWRRAGLGEIEPKLLALEKGR